MLLWHTNWWQRIRAHGPSKQLMICLCDNVWRKDYGSRSVVIGGSECGDWDAIYTGLNYTSVAAFDWIF